MTTRRKFLAAAAAAAPAAAFAAPAIAQSTIRWRLQTYAGPALAKHVIVPAIEMFNKIAGDRMQIQLFFADQLVPTGELFQAMQRGTIDAVQSDDDSMASPGRLVGTLLTFGEQAADRTHGLDAEVGRRFAGRDFLGRVDRRVDGAAQVELLAEVAAGEFRL